METPLETLYVRYGCYPDHDADRAELERNRQAFMDILEEHCGESWKDFSLEIRDRLECIAEIQSYCAFAQGIKLTFSLITQVSGNLAN